MISKRILAVAIAAAAVATIGSANAADPTFDVKITITAACTLTTGNDVVFADTASNATTDQSAQADLTVNCTKGSDYAVTLSGAGTLAGTAGNADTVAYTLYKEAAHTNEWGSTATNRLTDTGTGTDQTKTVYAQILAGALNVKADTYSDTVTASVSLL